MAARAQAAQAEAQAAQARPFALSPALANREVIDYSEPSGAKLFKTAKVSFARSLTARPRTYRCSLPSYVIGQTSTTGTPFF